MMQCVDTVGATAICFEVPTQGPHLVGGEQARCLVLEGHIERRGRPLEVRPDAREKRLQTLPLFGGEPQGVGALLEPDEANHEVAQMKHGALCKRRGWRHLCRRWRGVDGTGLRSSFGNGTDRRRCGNFDLRLWLRRMEIICAALDDHRWSRHDRSH